MPIIQTADLSPGSQLVNDNLQTYCGLDCCVTLEVHEVLSETHREALNPSSPGPGLIYQFERALQAPYLEIMQRGFRVDEIARRQAAELLRMRMYHLQQVLDEFAQAVWGKGLNPASPKQLTDFFYRAMGLPEVWISQKGVKKLSTNREALEKLEKYLYARPFVSTILALRDIKKQLDVFETEIDPDGRFRAGYNIAGTETGRPSSSSNAFGTACLRGTAEALTPLGWVKINELVDGDKIAQWCNGKIEFVEAFFNSFPFKGKMLRVSGEQFDLTVTPDHRIPFYTWRNKNIRDKTAIEMSKLAQAYIPLSGEYLGGNLEFPSYLPMLMADFSQYPWGWRANFKKERKIKRFLDLANLFGFRFTEQKAPDGYRCFYVPEHQGFPKKWGAWVLSVDIQTAKNLVEETRYWDANDRGSGFIFYIADKEQAEWFATLVHISGKSATIRREEQSAGSWSDTVMYHVNVKDRDFAQIMQKHWENIDYEGDVFCPTVPSSYWLVRENGKICVTGNSNAQNIAANLRYVFVSDPGLKMCVIDLEQVEARDVGFFIGCLFGDWKFLDNCESGDLHTNNAKLVWPELSWTGDPRGDRAIADQIYYRDMSYRDMAKRGSHLSNYSGTAWTAARALKTPLAVLEEFQARYCRGRYGDKRLPDLDPAFPGIPRYWQWVAQQLQTTQTLVTPFGRTRHFFGRPEDPTTLREAIAFVPQSTTADRMNLGLWRVWKHLGAKVQLQAQTYDSITFQYDPAYESEIIPQALDLIRVELRSDCGRSYVVPGEAKVGWNWGGQVTQADVDRAIARSLKPPRLNPLGLTKWKPGFIDQRVPPSSTPSSILQRVMT